MSDIQDIKDDDLVAELSRRLAEKTASIKEMEFMTKKLLTLNEQAKEAESIKSKFLSLIKNEFNNPIASLLNLANILEKKSNQDRFDSIVAMLNAELLRLDFQLKNIFAVTEIEEGQIQNHYSRIKFDGVFEDAISALRYTIDDRKLTVALIANEDHEFVSDAAKVYMILLNLLSNACEYSYEGAKVGVSLKKDDKFFTIVVEDSGEGISVQYAAQVYNRFVKFDSGKTRSHSGLGLGLSVVRSLAEALDGSVDFDSVEGSTIFKVRLPIVTEAAADSASDGSGEFLFDDFESGSNELEL